MTDASWKLTLCSFHEANGLMPERLAGPRAFVCRPRGSYLFRAARDLFFYGAFSFGTLVYAVCWAVFTAREGCGWNVGVRRVLGGVHRARGMRLEHLKGLTSN